MMCNRVFPYHVDNIMLNLYQTLKLQMDEARMRPLKFGKTQPAILTSLMRSSKLHLLHQPVIAVALL
jgi:hypothetical protein